MQPLISIGLGGEPIHDWKLISQSCIDGKVKSVFEAASDNYDKTYHLEDISGDEILLEQHLTVYRVLCDGLPVPAGGSSIYCTLHIYYVE